ncbi:MAG: hypothetical protein GXY81_04330 [Candidatus Cloacimonetes bacterium]|nr:hypothetical protein [Candidatus Cloacimonadota bacterium]
MRKIIFYALTLSALLLTSCIIEVVNPPNVDPTPFVAYFQNMLYTDIRVTVQGYGTKVVAPGKTVSFSINRNDGSYHYEAETWGSDADGNRIGLVVEWSRTRNISGDSYTTSLITDSDLFFLKMRNTGRHNLHPLYVNWSLGAQSMDDISIPGNGVLYNTGYYKAYSSTQVRAYWADMPSDYTYWQQGSHFLFPWEENQSITLLNTFKSSSGGKESVEIGVETESNPVKFSGKGPHGVDAGTLRSEQGMEF